MTAAMDVVRDRKDRVGHADLMESAGGFSVMVSRAHMILSMVPQESREELGEGMDSEHEHDLGEGMGSTRRSRQQRETDYRLQQSREQLWKDRMKIDAVKKKLSVGTQNLGETNTDSRSLRVSMNFEYSAKSAESVETADLGESAEPGESVDLGESADSARVWHVRASSWFPASIKVANDVMAEAGHPSSKSQILVSPGAEVGEPLNLKDSLSSGPCSYKWICAGQCADTPGCSPITDLTDCRAAGASLGGWPDEKSYSTIEQFASDNGFEAVTMAESLPNGCVKGLTQDGLNAGKPFGIVTPNGGAGTCAPSKFTGVAGCACRCTPPNYGANGTDSTNRDNDPIGLRGRMRIFVKTPARESIPIDVKAIDPIETVKAQVEAIEGVPLHQQSLTYGGKTLEDDRSLLSYGIAKETTLDLKVAWGQIFVKIGVGNTITIDPEGTDSIQDVKELIQAKEGIPLGQQILAFEGKVLDDDRSLLDYHISKNSTLVIMNTIRIFVKTPSGKTINIDVEDTDPVHAVKEKIEASEGIPPKEQVLSLDGKPLEDDRSLLDYGISTESTLEMGPTDERVAKKVIDLESKRRSKELDTKQLFSQQTDSMEKNLKSQNKTYEAETKAQEVKVKSERDAKNDARRAFANREAAYTQDELQAKSLHASERARKTENITSWDDADREAKGKRITVNMYERDKSVQNLISDITTGLPKAQANTKKTKEVEEKAKRDYQELQRIEELKMDRKETHVKTIEGARPNFSDRHRTPCRYATEDWSSKQLRDTPSKSSMPPIHACGAVC